MYLSDKDIKVRLPALQIECSEPLHPFSPDEQIQPCSIDVRLDNVFWEPKKVKSLDLRKSKLLELSPRRYWKKLVLKSDDCITIKPGNILFARIYEKITIPNDCAGKIEGRSSFSRLGIGIHISGDFINPGWHGHMPLQIINYSKNEIKLFPYIYICQVMLLKLTSTPDRLYGIPGLESKYMNDDGEPSYWWRDKRIKSLQAAFVEKHIDIKIQEKVFDTLSVVEPEIIERFEVFISKRKNQDFTNVDYVITAFAAHEAKLKQVEQYWIQTPRIILGILCGFTSKFIYDRNFTWIGIVLYSFTVIFVIATILSIRYEPKQYLTAKELQKKDLY